jgi:hypothetical protein
MSSHRGEERIPVSVNARSAEHAVVNAAQVNAYASRTDASDLGPWPILRVHSRAIGVALATCLVLLVAVELAVFRSGFFASHVTVSNPQTPAAKLALAARQADARVLYVGDSTIMTSVLPSVVSEVCRCGPGFNAGFSAANPWLTDAMTKRVIDIAHPRLVVISASPWTVDGNAQFDDSDLARQLMSPADLSALGARLDLVARIDASLGSLWSAYGQRELLKEWVGSASATTKRSGATGWPRASPTVTTVSLPRPAASSRTWASQRPRHRARSSSARSSTSCALAASPSRSSCRRCTRLRTSALDRISSVPTPQCESSPVSGASRSLTVERPSHRQTSAT